MRILLIDNYDSYTWNVFQLLWRVSGVRPEVIRNDEARARDVLRAGYTHIVISPGPGTPARAADFGLCRELITEVTVPCLGVCLGHEGLALAFGGVLGHAPEIMHGRTSAIAHDGTGVFAGLPQGFKAVRYHSLAVFAPLPPPLRVTAWSDNGVIMGLAHRERPLYGVQFHPESIETECGDLLIANFLGLNRPDGPPAGEHAPPLGSPALGRESIAGLSSPAAGPPAPEPAAGSGPPALGRDSVAASPERARDAVEPGVRWEELGLDLDAQDLFLRVFADRPYAFWLDSARGAYEMGRYSFLGACPDDGYTVVRAHAAQNLVEEETADGIRRLAGTIFAYLRERLGEPEGRGGAPVPFAGGYVGYLGYGIKGSTGSGRPGGGPEPDAEFLLADRFAAYDHDSGRAYLITAGLPARESRRWCAQVRELARRAPATPSWAGRGTLTPLMDRRTYREHFDVVQSWLRDGESYEACYTYQMEGASDDDPLAVYLRLRAASPAPYAAYLRFGPRRVLSSSPERFVRVDERGWAETKPIKGTAPRHQDPARDEQERLLLALDDKTRSENLMIVDLLRNDLGRVCEVGTVHVPRLMAVESYATVHQLVTTVRGRLPAGTSGLDCVEALFPGGSMTGAPKKRTVELLDGLEPAERGVYSGCLGYLGFDGQVDQSIVIRTIVWEGGRIRVGVGGALTVMSDPDLEYEETLLKARALLAVLGVEEPAGSHDDRVIGGGKH